MTRAAGALGDTDRVAWVLAHAATELAARRARPGSWITTVEDHEPEFRVRGRPGADDAWELVILGPLGWPEAKPVVGVATVRLSRGGAVVEAFALHDASRLAGEVVAALDRLRVAHGAVEIVVRLSTAPPAWDVQVLAHGDLGPRAQSRLEEALGHLPLPVRVTVG